MMWWMWVLVVVAVLVIAAVALGWSDLQRYLRIRRI